MKINISFVSLIWLSCFSFVFLILNNALRFYIFRSDYFHETTIKCLKVSGGWARGTLNTFLIVVLWCLLRSFQPTLRRLEHLNHLTVAGISLTWGQLNRTELQLSSQYQAATCKWLLIDDETEIVEMVKRWINPVRSMCASQPHPKGTRSSKYIPQRNENGSRS